MPGGHIRMRSLRLRFPHSCRPRCNTSAPMRLHTHMGYVRTLFSLDLASSISSALVCVRILVMGELLLLHHSMHFDLQTKRSPNYMVSFTVRTEGKRERCPTDDTLSVHGRATNGWDWESEEGQLQLASEDRGIASNATT